MSERLAQLEQFVMGQNSTIASLTAQLAATKQENEELQKTFDMQWDANMRGIKAWQAANPGNDLVWPDQAKLVEWLLSELERLRKIEAALPKTADGVTVIPGSVVYYRYGSVVQEYKISGFTSMGTVYFDPSGFSAIWDWGRCFSCEALAGDGGGNVR